MRLKTKSAMLSDARMPMSPAAFDASGISSRLAISPATRPTPTTEIGPFGSRSPGPERGVRHVDDALRQVHDDPGDPGDVLADGGEHRGDGLLHGLGSRG